MELFLRSFIPALIVYSLDARSLAFVVLPKHVRMMMAKWAVLCGKTVKY
jgi:hypothetical protein